MASPLELNPTTVTVDEETLHAMAQAAAMNEVKPIEEGPYKGQQLKGRVLQDGDYAGEQLASAQSGFSCIDGDEFGGFIPADLKYLHNDLINLGPSKLFLDADSMTKGAICFETDKAVRGSKNEEILEKTGADECSKTIGKNGKEKCKAIHDVVQRAQGEQSAWEKFVDGSWTGLGFAVAGAAVAAVGLLLHKLLKGRGGGGDGGTRPGSGGGKNPVEALPVPEAPHEQPSASQYRIYDPPLEKDWLCDAVEVLPALAWMGARGGATLLYYGGKKVVGALAEGAEVLGARVAYAGRAATGVAAGVGTWYWHGVWGL